MKTPADPPAADAPPADLARNPASTDAEPISLAAPDPGGLVEVGPLGRGAMGEVVRARDAQLRRDVAVKHLDGRLRGDPSALRRFVGEAQLTAQLDHPGIVPVHALDLDDNDPRYAMKLVRGRTLRAVLDEAREIAARGRVPPRLALPARLELFLGICEPLHYAHVRGVIHRDLKPDNIMVGAFGEVFVMDWGVARVLGHASPAAGPTPTPEDGTQDGDAIGTPAFMSPEQARGENETIDARSDQYALGLLLYELATLRKARGSVKPGIPMLLAATRGHVDPLVPGPEALSRELRAVIRRALAERPGDRYPDVAVLAADVRHVLRGEAVLAAPDGPLERVGRAIGRNRDRAAAVLVAAILLGVLTLVGLAGAGLLVRETDRQRAEARQGRLVAVSTAASDRARALDRAFLRYEGLLRGLGAAAERTLGQGGDAPVFLGPAWGDPATAPPDLENSQVYGSPASFEHADSIVAAGLDPGAYLEDLRALSSLRPQMARVLLESGEATSSPRTQVLQAGTPVVWSYVATESGLMAGFPGTGAYPPGYDPRQRPWYTQGFSADTPTWGLPYVDESGMGLLMSCAMPLRDASGQRIGVAGLDLTVRWLLANFIDPAPLPAEGLLVDARGEVVLATTKGPGGTDGTVFYRLALTAVVESGEASGQRVEGELLYAWSRLQEMPWTYVLVGPEASLLAAQ
jgi:serine/threonine-protein kinase